jgi:hypothetical protein
MGLPEGKTPETKDMKQRISVRQHLALLHLPASNSDGTMGL